MKRQIILCCIFLLMLISSISSKNDISDRPILPEGKEFVIKLKIINEYEVDTIKNKTTSKTLKKPITDVKIRYRPNMGYKLFEPEPGPEPLNLKEYYFKLVFETGGDPTTYIEIYKNNDKLLFNWIQPGKKITILSGEAIIEF